jgi:hypothetical protein
MASRRRWSDTWSADRRQPTGMSTSRLLETWNNTWTPRRDMRGARLAAASTLLRERSTLRGRSLVPSGFPREPSTEPPRGRGAPAHASTVANWQVRRLQRAIRTLSIPYRHLFKSKKKAITRWVMAFGSTLCLDCSATSPGGCRSRQTDADKGQGQQKRRRERHHGRRERSRRRGRHSHHFNLSHKLVARRRNSLFPRQRFPTTLAADHRTANGRSVPQAGRPPDQNDRGSPSTCSPINDRIRFVDTGAT